MAGTGESYRIYQNLHQLCKYRGASVTSRVIESAEHIAQMDAMHYVQITAERAADDVRGAAHIMIAQLANGHNIETKSDLFRRFLDRFIRAQKKDSTETNIIVVTSQEISPNVRAIVDGVNVDLPLLFVEHVLAARVSIIVPQHEAVPEHIIESNEEVKRICDELHVARTDFPRIVASGEKIDAIAIWLGLRPGMVVRVRRISSATGYSDAYRTCL